MSLPLPAELPVSQPARDLEPLLVNRRRLEAEHHSGDHAHSGDFLIHHDRLIAWSLKTALRLCGLYERGKANALNPVVRRLRVPFPGLPTALDGFRILQISDLHIDGTEGLAEVVADRLSSLPVDLCVLTGDYRFDVYGPCDRIYPRMRQVLDAVRSHFGIVGILGNHDCADIAVQLEKMGVRMLVNESIPVGPAESPVWAIGVDDPHYYGCDDLESALGGVPEDQFRLLLAHTPEMYRAAAAAGIDLYLCGHTHAGQIRLPGIGPVIQFADSPRALAYGRWNHEGMEGYTTAGVGNSMLPIRFNCPPELVIIELTSGAANPDCRRYSAG